MMCKEIYLRNTPKFDVLAMVSVLRNRSGKNAQAILP